MKRFLIFLAFTLSLLALVSCGGEQKQNCEHSFISSVTKEPTCTEAGEKTYTCSKCEYSYTEAIAANHNIENGFCTRCKLPESTPGLEFKKNVDGTYTVTGIGDCQETSISIGIYKDSYVTSIGFGAFEDCTILTSVTIGNSVTSIGDYAFNHCTSLTSVKIPDSVTSIGEYAFANCYKLVEVINKSSLNITKGNSKYGYIGYYALYVHNGESKIVAVDDYLFTTYSEVNYLLGYTGTATDITLPESYNGKTYEIYKYAFYDCTSLASVTIPDSVTSIGEEAFYYCRSLTSVTIGDSVTSIGNYAFDNCYKLVEVINKSSLNITKGNSEYGDIGYYALCVHNTESKIVTVGDYLFITYDNVNYLLGYTGTATDITLPESYNGDTYEIYNYAFRDCSSLTSVTIGNSVTSIGERAFYCCTSLTSVTIGNSVTSIGYGAFSSCTSLKSVIIPDSVTSIGDYAFNDCTSLTSVYITDIANWCGISFGDSTANPVYYAKKLYLNGELVTELVIPDSVTSIGNRAFYCCTSLTSVTIPDSVTSIGEDAFSDCTSLTSITIPDSVTSIGEYAFCDCSNLKSVTIGNGVTSIGDYAFYNCYSLASVTIPDSVTSIGNYAFSGCSSLTYTEYDNAYYLGNEDNPYIILVKAKDKNITSCTIHKDAKFIHSDAFCYSSLASVTIPNSVTSIGNSAFNGCRGLTSVTIPDSVTSIGDSAFWNCTRLISVTIPNSVTSIGERAFEDCTSLTSIKVDANNTAYKDIDGNLYSKDGKTLIQYAVGKTDKSFTIPNSVTSIGDGAFSSCTSLINVTIGNGVTSIGDSAFRDCDSLTRITIPDSVTSIGDYAFSGCNSLKSVTISDSVTSIGSYTFDGCSSLTSITIPDSVTSIGDGAFRGCDSLKSVIIGNSVKSIGKYAFEYCDSLTSVTFENPDGWWVASSSDATSGTSITGLSDASTAAKYLWSTYYSYYWRRG